MELYSVDAGNFKLDGGAMFGVVPKTLWNKKMPADELNLCSWKMRCLLIQDGKRLILVDTGMGDKQPAKWQSYYYRHGDGDLIQSIRKLGFHENQITDVILSHLHFDHAGGAVSWNSTKDGYRPTFVNATYWTHSEHWQWAMEPNPREAATFLKENLLPLQEAGQLHFIDKDDINFGNQIEFLTADGHTEKMLMPLIHYHEKKVLFIADTIPSTAHIHTPWVMAYDVNPLQTMVEKEELLTKAVVHDWILYFDHDPAVEACTIQKTDKGFSVKSAGNLLDF